MTCDQDLIDLCVAVIPHTDFTVLCGFRGEEEQNEAFETGRSRLKWPFSKHNHHVLRPDRNDYSPLSLAVDIAPWHPDPPHIRWDNEREFVYLAGMMMQAAFERDIKLRWGGNWDMDADLYDKNVPFDLVHFELL